MTWAECNYIRILHDGGPVATVLIDRPHKRNALDYAGWQALGSAFTTLGNDRRVRALILTGVPGAFCAGDDITAFAAVQDDSVARQCYWDAIMACYAAISAVPFPVIAAVDGPCIGGGCTIALRADFRIAGPQASFGVPPARLGLVYPAESTALLARIVGDSFARFMLYSGQKIDADRAVAAGLAWRSDGPAALDGAHELAAQFAFSAPLSVRAAKQVLDALAGNIPGDMRDRIDRLAREAEQSGDRQEGIAAFREKRVPRFTGQ